MMMMFLLSPSEIMHRTLNAVYHLSISLADVTFNFSDNNYCACL